MRSDSNLVWIDLEMTGLNPNNDVILEIATIITDSNLIILEQGPHLIIHQPNTILNKMGEWVREQHMKSGLTEKVKKSTTTIKQAEQETLTFIKKHCEPNTALLSGNSIWQDRIFLHQYMPSIVDYMFYRMIDVSTIKELVSRWYPDDQQVIFTNKKETHRALDDINESIEELKHYRKYFFV